MDLFGSDCLRHPGRPWAEGPCATFCWTFRCTGRCPPGKSLSWPPSSPAWEPFTWPRNTRRHGHHPRGGRHRSGPLRHDRHGKILPTRLYVYRFRDDGHLHRRGGRPAARRAHRKRSLRVPSRGTVATAALLGGVAYAVLYYFGVDSSTCFVTGFIVTLSVRLAAIRWNWNLPSYIPLFTSDADSPPEEPEA